MENSPEEEKGCCTPRFLRRMGSMISSFFQTGGHLLSSGTSETTRNTVLALLQDMREKEMTHIEWCSIETYISNIPKVCNLVAYARLKFPRCIKIKFFGKHCMIKYIYNMDELLYLYSDASNSLIYGNQTCFFISVPCKSSFTNGTSFLFLDMLQYLFIWNI